MNLSLYIFGAVYISRGKLAPVVGLLLAKPFGWGSSPHDINEAIFKSLTTQACWPRWQPKISRYIGDKLRKY